MRRVISFNGGEYPIFEGYGTLYYLLVVLVEDSSLIEVRGIYLDNKRLGDIELF